MKNNPSSRSPTIFIFTRVHRSAESSVTMSRIIIEIYRQHWNPVAGMRCASLAHWNRNSCGKTRTCNRFESAFEGCIGNSRRFQVSIDFYRSRG